jgi:hypothetical protein
MTPFPDEPDDADAWRSMTDLLDRPPAPINWNLLDAEQAEIEIRNRDEDFAEFVREDVLRRRRIAAIANQQLIG